MYLRNTDGQRLVRSLRLYRLSSDPMQFGPQGPMVMYDMQKAYMKTSSSYSSPSNRPFIPHHFDSCLA